MQLMKLPNTIGIIGSIDSQNLGNLIYTDSILLVVKNIL